MYFLAVTVLKELHLTHNSRAIVNVGIKKIILYSSQLGLSVKDWGLVNNITVVRLNVDSDVAIVI